MAKENIKYNHKIEWLEWVKLSIYWKKEKDIVLYISDVVNNVLNKWVWSKENIEKLKKVPLNLNDFSLVVRKMVLDLKTAINWESARFSIENNLSEIESLIDGYLLQLVWKSELLIRFCKWKDEIFSNSYLKWMWEQKNVEDWHKVEKLYDEIILEWINKLLGDLINWNLVWYNKCFTTIKWNNTIWSTNAIPDSDYNIRIWIPLKSFEELWNDRDKYSEYIMQIGNFYTPKTNNKFNFSEKDFLFLNNANTLINDFESNKQYINWDDSLRQNYKLLVNYIYMAAFTLDYFFKFNPTPAKINRWKKFPILSESFIKLTWYTRKELEDYFFEITKEQKEFQSPQIRWEIDSLLYKWDDYKKVIEFTKKNEINAKNWEWYKDEVFTITTKSWMRVDLPWLNIMFVSWNKEPKSLRIANIWKLKIHWKEKENK